LVFAPSSLILTNYYLPLSEALYAKGVRMKYIFLIAILLLSGCSSQSSKDQLADIVFEAVTGKDISRNSASCSELKRRCTGGNYEEWPQQNGQIGCVCN